MQLIVLIVCWSLIATIGMADKAALNGQSLFDIAYLVALVVIGFWVNDYLHHRKERQ